MMVGVLGAAEVRLGGDADGPVDLGTRKQRALFVTLVLSRGRPVSVDTIVDVLWGGRPPPSVNGTLQAYVAGLRRSVEPARAARASSTVIVTESPGYAVRLPVGALDADRFDRTVAEAHALLAPLARLGATASLDVTRLRELSDALDDALALWRGVPYLELEDAPGAVAERTRLEELRLLAIEDRSVAHLALGQDAMVAAELEVLTTAHPLRERLWALRAVALTRAGRQSDALDALRQVRDVLSDELGLEPGPELREIQAAVLRQDPALEWRAPHEPAVGSTTAATATPATATPATATPASPGASDPSDRVTTPRVTPPISPTPVAPWPLVGRDRELQLLGDALSVADTGTPAFAALVGDPGIGKSRLATELAAVARGRGVQVLVGRCSQDQGAPPLRPWAAILRELGEELATVGGEEDPGAQFRTWESIVRSILTAARERTLVVGLDDLHWADYSTLRVLRLLVESADTGRLLVLVTWRPRPEPSGALADVAENLGRRHALRLDLEGLSPSQTAVVVEAVSDSTPSEDEAAQLCRRTDGNPFFLVEYARLARESGDLGRLVRDPDPPSAVNDVLVRRLQRQPEPTLTALRTAALIGRQFDVATLSGVMGVDEEDVLDRLDAALEAGLVREDGIDHFQFSHALVRDAIASGLSASRRARLHARIAQVVDGSAGHETEVARHWLAAGPAYAARAWPAALAAASVARHLHAHEQASSLIRDALAALADDPDATPRDRFDLLMELAEPYRWAGDWTGLTATVIEAVRVAEEIGDVELIGRAAAGTTVGVLWQSAPDGLVHEGVVRALRRALDELPPNDGPLRCRVMLSLANETYYGSSFEERRALVEEAVAMARRLADDALLLDALLIGYYALRSPRTVDERIAYADEAMAVARRTGSERGLLVAVALRMVAAGERGDVDEMWTFGAEAGAAADRLRVPYGRLVVEDVQVPWLAMAGRFAEAEDRLAGLRAIEERVSLADEMLAHTGALRSLRLWQGRVADVLPALADLEADSAVPSAASTAQLLLRAGRRDDAVAFLATHEIRLHHDAWYSLMEWCGAAEVALELGDPALASAAYDRLAPFAGLSCTAGSTMAMGPVDAYLALAAVAVGETALAATHADAALTLCDAWRIPVVAIWFRHQRDLHAF